MEARKVQIKFFIDSPADVDVAPIVPVFHDWIRQNAFDELLIDVTEYGHVPEAPALLLVGSASDYAIDFADGRPGVLYSRKRQAPSDLEACILDALRRALAAAKRLEQEPSLPAKIRFRGDELVLRLNDRLRAPNTPRTLAAVEPVLRAALAVLYAGIAFRIEPVGEPRDLFGVRVTAPGAPGVSDLLARIA